MQEVRKQIIEKADELRRAESEVLRIEAELKDAKADVERVNHEMAEIMSDAELTKFAMEDGTEFSIKEQTFVNLKAEDRAAFYKWCEENGLGGVIKTTVEIPVAQGHLDEAQALVKLLGEGVQIGEDGAPVRFEAGRTSKIEPSTLRKLAADRVEAGEVWPEHLAKISIVKTVKIKEPKKK